MTTHDDNRRAERLRQAIRLKKAAARSRTSELPLRPADQPAHLGEMQRSLWLVHRMDPLSPAYNLTSAFRVRGALDIARLRQAFSVVVSRHRLLRSTFRVDRDTVLQVVDPDVHSTVEVIEVAEGEAPAAAVREAHEAFDLEIGPLFRLRLIEERSSGERLLLLVLHHILADERSLGQLWREIAGAYDGRLPDAESPLQYDDYVHWQRTRAPGDRDDELSYWRRRLDPLPDDLRFSFENPAGDREAARGRLLRRAVSDVVQRAVRRLAAETGATPFMVFAFAFRLLLQRSTEGRHVAFATPVSTRSHPATAKMLGYFTNPVVVSTSIDEGQRVAPAIRDFSRELRDLLAHASVPFDVLAEELSPPRRRDRHPVFQVMFVHQETPPPPELGGARLEPVPLDLGASKFDLTLFVTEGEDALEIAVEYRADRFDEIWMRNLLGHYQTLLEQLPRDPERAAVEVPMLEAEEQKRLLADAQGAEPIATGIDLLPRRILEQARRSPESPAVSCGGILRSYGELGRAARSIAHQLTVGGVEPGDRVAVFIDRSDSMIAGVLGSHWAGAAYVPLDPSYPEARNRDLLEDAEVAAVLTTSALHGRLPRGPWSVVDVDVLGGSGVSTAAVVEPSPQAPAYILYTSGSTGQPKGVVVSHSNLRASTAARLQVYDTSPKRYLLVPSVAFDSSVAGIFWTLAVGGALVIPTDDEVRDPRRLARLIADERVTTLLSVPSLYEQLLKADSDLLQGLEVAIVAGENCPSRLVEEHFRLLPGVRLYNEYGPTEATVWATVHEFSARDAAGAVTIGRPIPGVRIDLLDAHGRTVPAGIPGQAFIAGPTVAQGYWRRRDLTDERFGTVVLSNGTTDRRYRTGDRMAWTADGRLLFLGRDDEQIKLRGFRIEPGEIEAALIEDAEVEQAAVVARTVGPSPAIATSSDRTQLVAFVRSSRDAAPARWREDLAQRLPDYMIPNRLVVLPELPRLPNGKIDRRQLSDMTIEAKPTVDAARPLPNTREQALASLWEALLGRTEIGLDDNFFELGGHSLLVVEMTLDIEAEFEVSLSAAEVFENPTVRELTRRIEQRGGSEAPIYRHLFPIQPGGRRIPFIVALPHFFTEMFAERFRGERPVYGLRGVGLRPEGNLGRWRSMSELGDELVDEIQRRFPDESCIIAGYSFGASMAVEAARIMEARGLPIHRLILIAPMPLDVYRLGPLRLQIDGLREPVEGLSAPEALRRYARANNPLTRRPYRRLWRWCAIEPWRRLLRGIGRLRKLAGLPLTSRILYADVRVDRFRLHTRYRPAPIHTPTVYFNAMETATDAAATWQPYFDGPLEIVETPDPHLDEASVEAARDVILRHLEALDDR